MKYIIIGNGRLAQHLCYYFKNLNLTVYQWHRTKEQNKNNLNKSLQNYLENTLLINLNNINDKYFEQYRILLLINDDQIINFIEQNSYLKKFPYLLHCSGSLQTNLAIRIHPLMTFTKDNLYSLELYKSMAFISCADLNYDLLLPEVPNKIYKIPKELVSYYHALCVINGNFTQILWQNFINTLESDFNLPKDIANIYIKQITNNFIESSKTSLNSQIPKALTGPLARKDNKTIKNNLKALKKYNLDLYCVYQKIINIYNNFKK